MTPISSLSIWMCGYTLGIVAMPIRDMGMQEKPPTGRKGALSWAG